MMKKTAAALVLTLLGACDENPVTPAATIIVVSGAVASTGAGAQLPVRVRVTVDGAPQSNTRVVWRAIEGGGSVDSAITRTDANGEAANLWELGSEPGQNLLLVSSANGSVTLRVAAEFQYSRVSVGFSHACALSAGGEAYCWGDNSFGKLGTGNELAASAPTRVFTNLRFSDIAAGWTHTCGLTIGHSVYCWGDNSKGQLGHQSNFDRVYQPTAVQSSESFTAIAVGYLFTCGVSGSGGAFCWGVGEQGQLGTGQLANSQIPARVNSSSQFKDIATGAFHACAVTAQGRAQCWGWNTSGELGANARVDSIARVPIDVANGPTFTDIATGFRHTCAIATDNETWCWGRNGWGEIGLPRFVSSSAPVRVMSTARVTQLDGGEVLTCGLESGSERAVCIGFDGAREYGPTWTPIAVTTRGSSIAVGGSFACMAAARDIICWGGSYGAPVTLPGRSL
jgi:alpha-tubulin suppressor-like RCC1 family protein